MSKIISIGTAVPAYRHEQENILHFMQMVYALDEVEKRKLRFLYKQSGISYRYSVIPDYCRPLPEWKFYPHTENLEPFPNLELRMAWFDKYAAPLSVDAIRKCLYTKLDEEEITHLITVSCTGMSAPGLDLQVMELLDLPKNIFRTSINFMGCYAAIHALKLADSFCKSEKDARVLVVCTELCTLHFQRDPTPDNVASGLLFSDGAAAVLVTPDHFKGRGLYIEDFYSEVFSKGKKDMSWELSSSGFLMTLSGYVPELIEEDFDRLVSRSLTRRGLDKDYISHWCVHPGGRRILDAIHSSMSIGKEALQESYSVLKQYGNMSSPTILFVLKEIMQQLDFAKSSKILGAAFGPGLTMETFVAST